MKTKKSIIAVTLAALIFGMCAVPEPASAASVKMNAKTKNKTVRVGESVTLKVKKGKKKAKWTVRSGKKCIRLRTKKKASVRVYGVREGRGTVRCKLGGRKMYCKIRVTAGKEVANKPSASPAVVPTASPDSTGTAAGTGTPVPTVSPTSEPAASPTVSPSASPKPTVTPCPTHIPTEDRLMAEPCKSYELPIEDENGFPIWRPFGATYYYFFGSDIKRANLREIIITDTNEVPKEAEWSMDVSEKQNGSVMAWYMDVNGDGRKEMTIGQKGGVVANPNSSYLFCELVSIKGLEHFYTSDVTDMSYMFYNFALTKGVAASHKLDLGGRFETGNVTKMNAMFWHCGYFEMDKLILGNFFDVSQVTDAVGMFWETGAMSDLTCYVKDEALKKWLKDANNYTGIKIPIEVMP